MTVLLLAAMATGASAPPRSAAEAAWHACIDRTSTNSEWAECGGRFIKAADAGLNAEWKRLIAIVDGKTKTDLIAEEQAWLAYRATVCNFYSNGDWGREGQVLHYQYCVAGVIERRTRELVGYRAFVRPK